MWRRVGDPGFPPTHPGRRLKGLSEKLKGQGSQRLPVAVVLGVVGPRSLSNNPYLQETRTGLDILALARDFVSSRLGKL